MQPKRKKAKTGSGLLPAPKPVLLGRAVSLLAARRGLEVLAYLLVYAVLYFFLGQLLVMDARWLRTLLNLAALGGLYYLMFHEGIGTGEGDAAFAEIAMSRSQAGKQASTADLARCYHPGKGFFTAFVGALPLLLLSLIHALTAVREHVGLGALPSWLSAYELRADISLALSYYHESAALTIREVLRLAVRLLVFPYVNLLGAGGADALLAVDRISPLLVLIAPTFYAAGYLQGPRRRAMIHSGIQEGNRKAERRRGKPRDAGDKPPRQLV